MRRTAVLVTPLARQIPVIEDAFYVGIDAGALRLLEAGIQPDFAIGDFDSMSADDLQYVKTRVPAEIHPSMKDEPDTQLALKMVSDYESILLVGGLGKRLDHTLANLSMMIHSYSQLSCTGEDMQAFVLEKGLSYIRGDWKYVSFYALEECILSLNHFKYELHRRLVQPEEIYTLSNEFLDSGHGKEGWVSIEKGRCLCILSRES